MSEQQVPPYAMSQGKPGMLQTIAILCLVDGILSVLAGFGIIVGLLLSIVGIPCIPIGAYAIVVTVLEIIYATQLLPEHPRSRSQPSTWRSCKL